MHYSDYGVQKFSEEVVSKIANFYETKLKEKDRQIECLKAMLNQENPPVATIENNIKEFHVECRDVGTLLYDEEWLIKLMESHDVIVCNDISKATGINHPEFWESMDGVPGKSCFYSCFKLINKYRNLP